MFDVIVLVGLGDLPYGYKNITGPACMAGIARGQVSDDFWAFVIGGKCCGEIALRALEFADPVQPEEDIAK